MTRLRILLTVLSIALFLVPGTLLQAQDQAGGPEDGTKNQHGSPNDLPLAVPVRIVEDNETALAREAKEKDAEQREKDDLIAQQGVNVATQAMNEATQSMKRASWVSVGFVGLGTLLLFWSLALTRQANAAAREAVKVTRDLGQIQMRSSAYVVGARLEVTQNGLYVYAGIKNAGTSHATHVKGRVRGSLIVKTTDREMPSIESIDLDDREFEIGVIVPGETSTTDSTWWADVRINGVFPRIFTHPDVAQLSIVSVMVELECKDVFGGSHNLVAQITCQQFVRGTFIGGFTGVPAERPIFRGDGTIKHLDFSYEEPTKS